MRQTAFLSLDLVLDMFDNTDHVKNNDIKMYIGLPITKQET